MGKPHRVEDGSVKTGQDVRHERKRLFGHKIGAMNVHGANRGREETGAVHLPYVVFASGRTLRET